MSCALTLERPIIRRSKVSYHKTECWFRFRFSYCAFWHFVFCIFWFKKGKKVKASYSRYRALGSSWSWCIGSQPAGHPPGGRLPLLSARPAVTFPASEHHRPLAGTKLYCLVTGENFRQYFYGIRYLGHPLTSENFTKIVPEEPLRRGS